MQPYSGASALAKVLRVGAVGVGVMYGAIKLSYYKGQAAKAAKTSAH